MTNRPAKPKRPMTFKQFDSQFHETDTPRAKRWLKIRAERGARLTGGLDRGGYICHGCAARRKGEWPEGHRASAHEAICPYCAQTGMLTSITDWRWPSRGGETAPKE